MELRRLCTVVVIGLIAASLAAPAVAGKSSAEFGRQLFTDTTLGGSTNDKSCASCHANGKGLEGAAGNKKLSKAINGCITEHLEGSKIDGRSAEMRSLKLYIESPGSAAQE